MSTDIVHAPEEGASIPVHKPQLADLCDVCTARRVRGQRITKLHAGLVEFGYAGLTRQEVAEAFDLAMAGPVTAQGGIIAMLVRRQLVEAEIVQKGDTE